MPTRRRTTATTATELCQYAALFYQRGWMPGTSGNLSIKVADRPLTLAVTPSSVDKGALTPRDILFVGPAGAVLRGRRGIRPSAETAIHLALYHAFPDTGAVFHVHTVHSTLAATHLATDGAVSVPGLEVLKGFQTMMGNRPSTSELVVLPNIDHLGEFARNVQAHASRLRHVPGFLIAHHGMTCWGRAPEEAEKHLELMEFLCQYLWELGRAKGRLTPSRRVC